MTKKEIFNNCVIKTIKTKCVVCNELSYVMSIEDNDWNEYFICEKCFLGESNDQM